MRNLGLIGLAVTALAALVPAQTLNLATGANNTGNVGGGIYFDLTVNTTLTINSIQYSCQNAGAGTFQSSVDMFVGPSTYVGNVATSPGPWIQVATTTPTTINGGNVVQSVNGVLNPAGLNPGTVTFIPGTYGIALRATNHAWSYTNGAFTFSNAQMSATLGAASNAFLTAPTFSPRSFNGALNYTLGGSPMLFAQRSPYGNGCYRFFRSIYELFPSSVFVDFNNTSMYWTFDPSNNRYSSIAAGTTPVQAVTSTTLGHLDDNNIVINLGPLGNPQPILFPNIGGIGLATSTVEMCSNGYVNLLGTAAAISNPATADWITGTAVRMGNHYDMDASVGGTTHYDYDPVTAAHLFTWLNVPTFNIAGSSNTFQMAFFANGDVEMRWGLMSLLGGGGWPTLVGFTPGATSVDPGSIDLSAALPTFTSGIDQPPLELVASAAPVLGTTVNLTTNNVTGVNVGICFLSLSDLPPFSPVGLDLGIIGAPGCVANVDLNAAASNVISNIGAPFPGLTVPFPIPPGPTSLIGQNIFSQSAWIDPTQNAAGILTSNAIKLKIGAF